MTDIVRTRIPPKGKRGPSVPDSVIGRVLQVTLGQRAETARRVGLSSCRIYQRIAESEYLQNIIQQIYDSMVDSAEGVVRDKINAKNLKASMFTLERMGKKRGWGKKPEMELEGEGKGALIINIIVDGKKLPIDQDVIDGEAIENHPMLPEKT